MSRLRVLVTGGSGFIAGHLILQLLEQGHLVRATLRSLGREADVRAVLAEAGGPGELGEAGAAGEALTFVAADLTQDAGWAEAVADVDIVLHVASPVMPGHVENEDVVIVPAREGALRVLRAARDAGVRRVVLTSAFHAVSWGHPHDDHVFADDDWTILDGPGVDAYAKSKTLAERAAWDFVAAEGGSLELTTMLPVAVMGPVMGRDISGSNHLIQRLLDGGLPGFPQLYIPIVDVRDVAAAHILAMTHPAAAGERLLLASGPAVALAEVGAILKEHLGTAAQRVPTRSIPNLVLRVAALFSPEVRSSAPDLGYVKKVSSDKARRLLDWNPRPAEQAIVAAGESLVRKRLLKS